MERSEPTLVPEWLRSTGSVSGGGSTTHHFATSSLQSDDRNITLSTRNRSSMNTGDRDSPRSTVSDRISSSYFRRSSSSNGSMVHDKDPSARSRSYSSFSRSHRDRDWERDPIDFHDKKRSGLSANVFTSRVEKDLLRRSQSMRPTKRSEVWPGKAVTDSNSNSVGGSNISRVHKAAFERDFPSLGAEEKQRVSDMVGISSPRLSTAVQSLPIGSSATIGGNGWTSALVEVPVIIGSNSMGNAPGSLSSLASSTTTGLNMAETLAQAPSRARSTPQLSVETQRLEELAIKQSRQLIPMTPSMPKTSAMNSEKQKPKAAARSETAVANKTGQQQLSSLHPVNQALRGGPVKSDVAKTSHGVKLVLKGARENDNSPTTKDSLNLTNAGRSVNKPLTPSAAFAPIRNLNNPKHAVAERKASALPGTLTSSMEKRSQVQSRNDFFNLMRKKNSVNFTSAGPDPSSAVASTVLKKTDELTAEVTNVTVSQGSYTPVLDPSTLGWSTENGGDIASNGSVFEDFQGSPNNVEKQLSSGTILYPDEEEAAFLRSLGWEENAGEEEGLTEEEISSFYEHLKLKPTSKPCEGMLQPKLQLLLNSHVGSLGNASSGPNSPDTKPNA